MYCTVDVWMCKERSDESGEAEQSEAQPAAEDTAESSAILDAGTSNRSAVDGAPGEEPDASASGNRLHGTRCNTLLVTSY